MSFPCAAKLSRIDKAASNITAVSAFSKNADVCNTAKGEKRSKRTPRKRKSLTEDCDLSDNVKKIKGDIKNTSSNSIKSSKNNSPKSDLTKTHQSIISHNVATTSKQSTYKIPRNKISKSLFSVKKKPLVNNVNRDDTHNELKRSCDFDTSISPKKKTPSKLTTSNKNKSITNNVNNDSSLNELERNVPPKNVQNKMSKSLNSIKNKTVGKNINKNDSFNEFEQSNDFTPSKLKTKTTKSINSVKNKSIEKKVNKSDTLNDLERNINILSPKLKNKTTKSNSSVKKSLSNNVNKIDTPYPPEGSEDSVFSQKRGRRLKKASLQKSDGSYTDDVDLEPTQREDILENFKYFQESESSKNLDDSSMLLRSNNKPPKIKQKWSEEWSENKLINNVTLKSNNDDSLSNSKIDVNTCNKLAKKVMKSPKPKMSNKKIKTKMLENPTTNTNDSLSNTYSNDTYNGVTFTLVNSLTTDSCTKNYIETQNHDSNLSENQFPIETVRNEVVNAAPEYIETVCHKVVNAEDIKTESNEPSSTKTCFRFRSASEDTIESPAYEPIIHSNYLSIPMISSECPEISYGISILSEAISRQCNAEINKDLKTKSPEKDIDEIKSPKNIDTNLGSQVSGVESNAEINDFKTKSPEKDINEIKSSKNNNSSLRSQVPSAMISPQRVQKNVSRKVVKNSSELCENSVESELQLIKEREIHLLSKRFNIPVDPLRQTVVEEPLSIFQKKYCTSITASMVTVSPIVTNVETKSKPNVNCASENLHVEYKVEPIRESAAYENTNLKNLMNELSKTMPSWSLSIVTNPQRYVISHMLIDKFGVPFVNKAIVLDKNFRASVYINKILEYKYSKRYSTPTEIVNLIKNLDSL